MRESTLFVYSEDPVVGDGVSDAATGLVVENRRLKRQ